MDTSHSHCFQQNPSLPVLKPTFNMVVNVMTELFYDDLQQIAKKAGVNESVLNDMYLSVAIHRVDAVKLLAAFSEYTKQTWTLEHVKVALLPTFADICSEAQLDFPQLVALFALTPISHATLDMMLTGFPVKLGDARSVLNAISSRTGKRYTLENVDGVLVEVQP